MGEAGRHPRERTSLGAAPRRTAPLRTAPCSRSRRPPPRRVPPCRAPPPAERSPGGAWASYASWPAQPRRRGPARGPQVTRAPCRRGIRTDSAVRATGLGGKGEADRRPACPAGARPAGASGEECPERSCESGYAGHVLPGSRRHPAVPHLVRHARIRVRVGFDGRYGLLGAHGPTAGSAQKRHPAPPAPLPRPAPRHRPPPSRRAGPHRRSPRSGVAMPHDPVPVPGAVPELQSPPPPPPSLGDPSRPQGPGAGTRDQGRRAGGVHGSRPRGRACPARHRPRRRRPAAGPGRARCRRRSRRRARPGTDRRARPGRAPPPRPRARGLRPARAQPRSCGRIVRRPRTAVADPPGRRRVA
ncbi:hypothetical protein TUE45_02280 [Streptomyces reticuli]|nr:hypothetical protein TUE45_02280 [Streptomyces reticuli]